MGDVEHGDAPRSDRVFTIELRTEGREAEVALVKTFVTGGPDAPSVDVWTHRFTDLAAARTVFGAMFARPACWATWARLVTLLGSDFLDGVIETEILKASTRKSTTTSDEAGPTREAAERYVENGTEAGDGEIRVRLVIEDDVSRIMASRNDVSFMGLALTTPAQAYRVWDWVRWQTGSYGQWFDLAVQEGPYAVARMIIQSVLDMERRLGAAPGQGDAQRPLRHWRPYQRGDGAGCDDGHDGDGG